MSYQLQLPGAYKRTTSGPVDALYTPNGGVEGYADVQQVLDLIPSVLRYDGLTVKMAAGGEMHWEQADLSDAGLKTKRGASVQDFTMSQLGVLDLTTSAGTHSVDLNQKLSAGLGASQVPDADFHLGLDGTGTWYQYGNWDTDNGYAHAEDGSTLVGQVYLTKGDYVVQLVVTSLIGEMILRESRGFGNRQYITLPGTYEIQLSVPYDTNETLYLYPASGPLICDVVSFNVRQVVQPASFAGDRVVSFEYDNAKAALVARTHDGDVVDMGMDKYATTDFVKSISGAAIPTTYQELVALRNSGQLKPGKWYLLSDWRLTHTIANTTETHTAPIEQLIVMASGYSQIAAQGYSVSYPQDIIYYSLDNNNRMPGSTMGYVYRRNDTQNNNDVEIDFRNVVFRRWLTTGNSPDLYGSTNRFSSCTDNGAQYQDFFMFSNYVKCRNNHWSGFDQYFNTSIFDSINFATDYDSRSLNVVLVNSKIVNVTVLAGVWFYDTYMVRSTLSNTVMVRKAFYAFLQFTSINSTVSNAEVLDARTGGTLYTTTFTKNENFANGTYINNIDTATLQTAVLNSTVLQFGANAEYLPLTTGTFTVDVSAKRVGVVVVAYLGPACTQPVLPADKFQGQGTYVAGKNLEYMFKVGANGFIQYTITPLD